MDNEEEELEEEDEGMQRRAEEVGGEIIKRKTMRKWE